MIGVLIGVAIYLAILIIVALAALRPPRSPIFMSPQSVGIPTEDVAFHADGIQLSGWWLCPENPRAVFVLLHGYVMNRAECAGLAIALYNKGYACLLFDFRACGKSGGKRSGIGWPERSDVLAACRFAEERLPNMKRVLVGSSMGSAAAAFALAKDPSAADAIVLDSSYNSLVTATFGWWRFLGGTPAMILLAPVILVAWPFAGFNPFRVNVGRALAKAGKPTLIIHGRYDRLASTRHADRNLAAAADPKRIIWFEGSHSEMRWTEPQRFIDEILSFLRDQGVVGPDSA